MDSQLKNKCKAICKSLSKSEFDQVLTFLLYKRFFQVYFFYIMLTLAVGGSSFLLYNKVNKIRIKKQKQKETSFEKVEEIKKRKFLD